MRSVSLAVLFAALLLSAACRESAGRSAPASATAIATEVPLPTPTPDPLGPVAESADMAAQALERLLVSAPGDPCPSALKRAWDAVCVTGDLDGDGRPDAAYLVPIAPKVTTSPMPAAVLVRRSLGPGIERLVPNLEADHSIFGRALFAAVDRTGDAGPELTFLTNECNARSCNSRVHVEHWDGTAWRDLGPDPGVDNIDRAAFEGRGAASVLTIHGGMLKGPGAGPSRAATYAYGFDGARYQPKTVAPDAPVYLYHAIVDADAKFDAGDWPGAIQAYQAAIENTRLRDWRQEADKGDGRASLTAYALFRIAVATAASGEKPEAAIDAVILDAKEELFVNAIQAFRSGFQVKGGVHPGCVAVTSYLAEPVIADYIRDKFDYGYANFPRKTYKEICPL